MIAVTTAIESAESDAWAGDPAGVAVVVSTHGRAALLAGLLDALEAQVGTDAEVIVADNGSEDDTWPTLLERCRSTPLRLRVLRLPFHNGPAVPRNTCVAASRAPLIAFTDDDCLPRPTWLAELVAGFTGEAVIVQGRTVPEPGGWAGPWGRTVSVGAASGLYETANLAVRAEAFDAAGGFPERRLLTGRAFGEDVLFGAAVARLGAFRFASEAVVQHRVMPGTYRDFIQERARLAGFPLLLRQVPELRQQAFMRIFLSRRTAITDLALTGVAANMVASVLTYSAWAIVPELAVVPWIVALLREARFRPGRNRLVRAVQLLYGDLAGCAALIAGSLRARRLLL